MTESNKTLEFEQGSNSIEVDIWPDGDVEVTISQEHYGWNDGGKAIAGDIILNNKQARELLAFLQKHLTQTVNKSIDIFTQQEA